MTSRLPLGETLHQLINGLGEGPLLVHSDLVRAGRVVASTDRRVILEAHLQVIREAAQGSPIWMPSFNYDFTSAKRFDTRTAPSQVGALTEFFRTSYAAWRTAVPIFSFSGIGDVPEHRSTGRIDPFGDDSAFAALKRRDGLVLFYGAPFSCVTMLHHAERLAGGPLYRYDKIFVGEVILQSGEARAVELLYHVRPKGKSIDYDFDRLTKDLTAAGILRSWESGGARLQAVSAHRLVDFWGEKLDKDPLYLLDQSSRGWVELELNRLGRRFEITDFE